MGCPLCKTDFDRLEEKVAKGDIKRAQELTEEIESELFLSRGLVIYCPDCKNKIASLYERIASRLRKETIAGIGNLLDQAHERKKESKRDKSA